MAEAISHAPQPPLALRGGSSQRQTAYVYPAWVRLVLSLLALWRWLGLWWVSLLIVSASDPPVTPPILVVLVAVGIVAPFILEALIRCGYRAQTLSHPEAIVVEFRWKQLEIPRKRVVGARPWRLPLPGPGLTLVLEGGQALRERIEVTSPRSWAQAHLLRLEADASARSQASLAFVEARASRLPRRWYHYVAKFFLFALIPAALLFQVHQRIAYGSVVGEYYQRGLLAYLRTWCVYYATVVTYLGLFAGLLRSTLEVFLWLSAQIDRQRAPLARRVGERLNEVAYYSGVLTLLALRFAGCG